MNNFVPQQQQQPASKFCQLCDMQSLLCVSNGRDLRSNNFLAGFSLRTCLLVVKFAYMPYPVGCLFLFMFGCDCTTLRCSASHLRYPIASSKQLSQMN